jgi:hypothetical protein
MATSVIRTRCRFRRINIRTLVLHGTPMLMGVIDDRSRLICHLQWYLLPLK